MGRGDGADDRALAVPLPPKINAPQHDPRRGALELRCLIFASRAGFDALAQAHELLLALVRPRARAAFEIVHGGGRDRARNLPRAVLHRELDDPPVLFVADKAAAGEGHVRTPLTGSWLATLDPQRLARMHVPRGRTCLSCRR